MDYPSCGFIGLGSQGAPIALRMIEAGLPVTLWARRPETLTPFHGSRALFAATAAELAAQVDHLGLCVLDDSDVHQVCYEVVPTMRPGARLAIHSTVLPETSRSVARLAAAHDVRVVDAPVSGGAPAAAAGALTVMAGGEPAEVEATRPIFETFARLIIHVGEVGSPQGAKLLNNSLMAANLGLADAAFTAAAQLGLDRAAFAELLAASSGRSFALEVYSRQPSLDGFANGAALRDKIRLLGEILGAEHTAVAAFQAAARPLG